MAKIRRNLAHLSTAERQQFVDALRQLDRFSYPDGVSYWDKQDQIHQGTHKGRQEARQARETWCDAPSP